MEKEKVYCMNCRYFERLYDYEYCRAEPCMSEGDHAYEPTKVHVPIEPKEQNKNNDCPLYKKCFPGKKFIKKFITSFRS